MEAIVNTYYRPEWTGGRYDKAHHAALLYNLLSGYSYFFEDDSADVIGLLLDVERNGNFSIEELSVKSGIATQSLSSFFQELEQYTLVTTQPITQERIANYRKFLADYKRGEMQQEQTTEQKLPMAQSTAEMLYADKVGGVTSVMFELTYRCSERCVHCYNIGATRNDGEESGRAKVEELTLAEYKRVIDEMYAQGLIKVCLTGGDPFSHPYAWDIMDYLHNKGIVFDVYTNGLRLAQNMEDVERLANYYPRSVGVSLYSGVARDHDYITRIKGSWEKSMKVLCKLSELAVPLNVKCCIMRPNLKTYYEIYEIAKELGAVPQMEINITDSIEGDKCARTLRLTDKELEVVLRDDNIKLYVGKEAPNYGGQKKDMKGVACGAGESSYCLTPNGNLIPCCSFHLVFGNVKDESVKDIISGSKAKKWWNNLTLEQYEECGIHDYCDYCNLCAGNNFVEHGTPTKCGENNCYTAKIRHDLAQRMMNGYDPLNGLSVYERLQQFEDYQPHELKRIYEES